MDKYSIDSHKLMYHPTRVAAWKAGLEVQPIYAEVGIVRGCNHRCTFCAFSEEAAGGLEYIDGRAMFNFISDCSDMGIRSMMLGGDGEPLLHPTIREIIQHIYYHDIDLGITTNGSKLGQISDVVDQCTWIKVSIDAGRPDTYAHIHGVGPGKFDELISTMSNIVPYLGNCTLGAQLLLLPENIGEVGELARILADIGVSYLTVKPYSRRYSTKDNRYYDYTYDQGVLDIIGLLARTWEDEDFNIIFRSSAFHATEVEVGYSHCHALPFWFLLDAAGEVYPCIVYYGNTDYSMGNINDSSISDIISGRDDGKVHADGMEYCNHPCRMHQVNMYLDRIYRPQGHDNFI